MLLRRSLGSYRISVSKLGGSESGQIMLEKVKWAYSDTYPSQTMWNHANKSMKRLKWPTSVFLQGAFGYFRSSLLKTWCTEETKTHVSEIVWIVWPIHLSRMEPCRRACPGHLKMYNIWVWSWIDQDTRTHENMDLRGKNCTQNILLFYDASDFYYALRKLFYMIRDCVLKHSKKTPSSKCVFNRT